MNNITISKPNTFVKDLPGIEKVRPEYADALDSFLFEWTESMLPFYAEYKRREADVFECLNVSTCGKDWAECYEQNGIHYRFSITPLWGRTLSLDGGAGYIELNWSSCFWKKHPEFDGSKQENYIDDYFFNWYFHRYYKKNPKYLVVTDRIRDYFRYLTGNSDVVFDVGWKSFIYTDPKIRTIINNNPSLYY